MTNEHTNPADRAADAIMALINSRPASPTKAEIAAVIASKMAGSPPMRGDAAGREAWSRVVAELEAAYEISGELLESTPEGAAAEAVTKAVTARYNAYCRLLWAVPPALADIGLLAQILYHQCHLGSTLTAPDADERLAAGSPSEGGDIDEAQAALLKAIRAQYLSGP
jgi:hypothetical protein